MRRIAHEHSTWKSAGMAQTEFKTHSAGGLRVFGEPRRPGLLKARTLRLLEVRSSIYRPGGPRLWQSKLRPPKPPLLRLPYAATPKEEPQRVGMRWGPKHLTGSGLGPGGSRWCPCSRWGNSRNPQFQWVLVQHQESLLGAECAATHRPWIFSCAGRP